LLKVFIKPKNLGFPKQFSSHGFKSTSIPRDNTLILSNPHYHCSQWRKWPSSAWISLFQSLWSGPMEF